MFFLRRLSEAGPTSQGRHWRWYEFIFPRHSEITKIVKKRRVFASFLKYHRAASSAYQLVCLICLRFARKPDEALLKASSRQVGGLGIHAVPLALPKKGAAALALRCAFVKLKSYQSRFLLRQTTCSFAGDCCFAGSYVSSKRFPDVFCVF